MKHIVKLILSCSGIVCLVMVALMTLGMGAVLADPPADIPTFANADINIEPRGEEAGGLTCGWRETGLGPYQVVYYTCEGGAVGALEACIYKNKLVSNTPTRLSVFHDVAGEHGTPVPFLSKNNGQINASTTTAIPESHGQPELCPEPTEVVVAAVRWCNASLTDATNGVLGVKVNELFQEFVSGAGKVPSCEELSTL